MAANALLISCPIRQFVRNYTHNSKTKGSTRTFYLSNDCSTIGDTYSFGLELYVRYHWQVMDPNKDRNHFAICRFMRCGIDVLHVESLLYYHRCLFSVLELDSKYKGRVTLPNTHRSLFPISHFYANSVLRRIKRYGSTS